MKDNEEWEDIRSSAKQEQQAKEARSIEIITKWCPFYKDLEI